MNYSAFDDCAAHYQGVGHDIEDAAKSLNLGPEKFALRDRIDSQRSVKDAPRQNRMTPFIVFGAPLPFRLRERLLLLVALNG